jgi:hypothetical protein
VAEIPAKLRRGLIECDLLDPSSENARREGNAAFLAVTQCGPFNATAHH